MSGIKVTDIDRFGTKVTLGWVAIDPDGTVRLHGFSEKLGTITRHGPGAWSAQDVTGHHRADDVRHILLTWLWNRREARLQAAGR